MYYEDNLSYSNFTLEDIDKVEKIHSDIKDSSLERDIKGQPFEKTTEFTDTHKKIFNINKMEKKNKKNELVISPRIEHLLPKMYVQKANKKIQTNYEYIND